MPSTQLEVALSGAPLSCFPLTETAGSSFFRNLKPRRKPVRVFFFDCDEKNRDASASGSCVFPADGSWSSSGGGEPEDGVVGDGEPGSGGEFIVDVVDQKASRRLCQRVFLIDDEQHGPIFINLTG